MVTFFLFTLTTATFTQSQAQCSNYPFTTAKENKGKAERKSSPKLCKQLELLTFILLYFTYTQFNLIWSPETLTVTRVWVEFRLEESERKFGLKFHFLSQQSQIRLLSLLSLSNRLFFTNRENQPHHTLLVFVHAQFDSISHHITRHPQAKQTAL